MSWSSSDRRSRLPADWPKRVVKVKARAGGRCEAYWTAGRVSQDARHHPDCGGIGSDCDHIVNDDNHAFSNLQWLSRPCHHAKTLGEAQAALNAKRAALKLPREAHPTRLTTT